MADKRETSIDIILRIIDRTKGEIKAFVKDMNQVEAASKSLNAETQKLAATQKKQISEQNKVSEQNKRAANDAKLLADRNKRLVDSIKGITNNIRDASKGFKSFRLGLKDVSNGAKSTETVLKKTQGTVRGLIGEFTILAASVAAVFAPVQQAAQFQRTMSEVKAISGAVGDEFKRLEKIAFDMGSTTEFTAVQAGEGLRFLAMAGLDVEQSIAALPSVLQVAQAGAIELGRAADIVTNIMTGFRFEATELGHVNDVLVQTFTNTNSTLEELGTALSYVGPIAAGLGGSFEDLVATLGALHNAGLKGTLAGTALRGMLGKLFNPTKAEAEQMKVLEERMGGVALRLRNSEGDFVGFVSVIKQLESAQLDAAEALELFGLRAGPGMAALLGIGSSSLEDFVRLNEEADGRAKQIAKTMTENAVGAFRNLKSAAQALAITIGNQLLPAITGIIDTLTDLVRGLQLWSAQNPGLTKGLIAVGSALATVVAGVKAYTISAGIARIATGKLNLSWLTGAGSATKFGAAIGKLGVILKGFLGVAAAFVAGWSLGRWISETELFRNKFGHTIGEVVQIITGQMFQAFEKAKFWFLDTFWYTPKEAFALALNGLANFVSNIIETVREVPILGKLWGWESDVLGITDAMKRLEKASLDMANGVVKDREKAIAVMNKELDIHNRTIDNLNKQGQQQAKLSRARQAAADLENVLQRREITLQKELKDATYEIEKQIISVTKAWDASQKKLSQVRSEFERFSGEAKSDLDNLKSAVDKSIGAIWEGIDADAGTAALRAQLQEIGSAIDISASERARRTIEIENEISQKRVDAISEGLEKSIALLEDANRREIQLEEASLIEKSKTEEQKAQIEEKHQEKIRAINEKTLDKKKEYYTRAQEALEAELEKSLSHEKNLADQIIALQDKITSAKTSAEEKIRDLRRKAMSEEEAYNDRLAEAREKIAKAEALAPSDLNAAIQLFKDAQSAAAGLVGEVKEGDKVVKTEQETINEAIRLIEEAQRRMESAAQAGKQALEGQLGDQRRNTDAIRQDLDSVSQKVIEIQDRIKEGATLEIKVQIEEFEEKLKKLLETKELLIKATADFNQASEELGKLNKQKLEIQKEVELRVDAKFANEIKNKMDELMASKKALGEKVDMTVTADTTQAQAAIELLKRPTSSTHTVYVNRVEKKAIGGPVGDFIQRFKDGGGVKGVFKRLANSFIPGNGSIDDVPAMLMKGEYVMRKAAVQKLGVPFLNALNNGRVGVDMVPQFAKGGLAGLTSGLTAKLNLIPTLRKKIQYRMNPMAPIIKNGVAYVPGDPTFTDHINARAQGIVTPGGAQLANNMVSKFTAGVQKLQTGGSIGNARTLYERERQIIQSEYNKKIALAQQNGDNQIANILLTEEEQLLSIAEDLELTLATLALELEATMTQIEQDYEDTKNGLEDTFVDTGTKLAQQKVELERNHSDRMAEINNEMARLNADINRGKQIQQNRTYLTPYGTITRPLSRDERAIVDKIDVNKTELQRLEKEQRGAIQRYEEDYGAKNQEIKILENRYNRDQGRLEETRTANEDLAIAKNELNVRKARNESQQADRQARLESQKQTSEVSFQTEKEVLTLQSQLARELIALEKQLAEQLRQSRESGRVAHFLASGGPIFSRKQKWIPGDGVKDDVPAMLMKGEYVIRKDAVKKFGVGFFDMLNSGKFRMPQMAGGGFAGFSRKLELMLNPLAAFKNDGVTFNINNPTFKNHIAESVGNMVSPFAQKSSKDLLSTFNSGVMKLQEGGDIGSAAQRLAAEKALITKDFQSRIDYARAIGQEEVAYLLEQEQIELAQLAEDLRFTLEELEAEYEFARAQAEILKNESIAETQYAYETAVATLQQRKAELEKEYEAAKQQNTQGIIAANAAFREARSMPQAVPQYRSPEEAYFAALQGKFLSPAERAAKNQALRMAREQAMNQAILQKKAAEDALKQAEIDYRIDNTEVNRSINAEQRNRDRQLGVVQKQYETDNMKADGDFERGTTRAYNENEIATTRLQAETRHGVSVATIKMEAEIKKLQIELEKELFKLDKEYATAGFTGVRHFLNQGGSVGTVPGAKRGIDSVKAMLTPGEFVLKESAAKALGLPFLNMLNNITRPLRFAEGGPVGDIQSVPSMLTDYSAKITLDVGGQMHDLRARTPDAKLLVKQLKKLGLRVA